MLIAHLCARPAPLTEKPFNPLLGETLQGRINGYPIYFEQVSHHPPTSRYLMYGKNYKLYGAHQPVVSLSANSLQGDIVGSPTIEFANTRRKVQILWWPFQISGITLGDRIMNCVGRAFAFDAESNLVCEVIFNPYDIGAFSNVFSKNPHKIDQISGAIYRVKTAVIEKFKQVARSQKNVKSKLLINPQEDVLEFVSKVSGTWHCNIKFDEVEYWNMEQDSPFVLEYEAHCLPSDSRFRKDSLYLSMGNIE